jgi:phage/plasmid primase-like uncharacterized protein
MKTLTDIITENPGKTAAELAATTIESLPTLPE